MSLDITLRAVRETEVWSCNITHNLTRMADEAGIYKAIWRPEECEPPIKTAGELVEILNGGLNRLRAAPDHYKQFNPSNGWGDYDNLVAFTEQYLDACVKNPDATIGAWR